MEVRLGEDDILRILHSFRSGSERMPLPNMPTEDTVNTIRRSAVDASSQFIHDSIVSFIDLMRSYIAHLELQKDMSSRR